jgi:hypothetical protein
MEQWRELSRGVRWTTLAAIATVIITLSNLTGALEQLRPWMLVTWGGLEAWAAPIIMERNKLISDVTSNHAIVVAAMEQRLLGQLNDIQWDQAIYRTKDLEFQISHLKDRQLQLQTAIELDVDVNSEINRLRRERLREVEDELQRKIEELRTLVCLVENRGSTAARC